MGLARYNSYTCKRKNVCAQLLQSYPTLCNPMNFSPPGSSVHGILQARMLEWVVIFFSRESSRPGDRALSPALQAHSLPSEPPGKPVLIPISDSKFLLNSEQYFIYGYSAVWLPITWWTFGLVSFFDPYKQSFHEHFCTGSWMDVAVW